MEAITNQEHEPVQLKEATVTDIPTLLKLEQSVAGTNVYSPMLEKSDWTEELQTNKVYLIEKNNVVVGNLSYERKSSDHVYVSGLVISPEFQGQGVAREVLTRLLKELKDVKRIDLVTHPENQKALQLYQSLGFVVESRKENYFGDGEPRLILANKKSGQV
ncbi:MAG: GNAT family N-acetyltransferase [Patescibacteria group bacterium]